MQKQRGLSYVTMLLAAIVLGFGMVLFFKLVPAFTEYFAVKRTVEILAKENASAPMPDIREAFRKRAEIEDIKAISAEDLEIIQDQEGTEIIADYKKIVPLIANASLMFEFRTSAKGGGG
ncbi:DUF4845 domain-containing protein [Chitinimonas lacunae]|uniref:DUF4845 domain-containing protein n=1 Tax=Chitinimonas lacunae TaxID=1963018 RepID=A0ABV8MNB7_9NEIS